jgi:hypothetical protein
MGKRWTDKEDAILETLRAVGMTFEEIAPIMGRTKHALQQRAHMLKRNEPTFREVVDTAFEKHGIRGRAYVHRLDTEAQAMFSQMEQDIKPKPQWWKAMMWWRK